MFLTTDSYCTFQCLGNLSNDVGSLKKYMNWKCLQHWLINWNNITWDSVDDLSWSNKTTMNSYFEIISTKEPFTPNTGSKMTLQWRKESFLACCCFSWSKKTMCFLIFKLVKGENCLLQSLVAKKNQKQKQNSFAMTRQVQERAYFSGLLLL